MPRDAGHVPHCSVASHAETLFFPFFMRCINQLKQGIPHGTARLSLAWLLTTTPHAALDRTDGGELILV